LKKKAESGPSDRSLFKNFFGGLLSSKNDEKTEIYFIGIIDTLTVYDLWKKGENVIKTVRYYKVCVFLKLVCLFLRIRFDTFLNWQYTARDLCHSP
jgi:hypothetical protein